MSAILSMSRLRVLLVAGLIAVTSGSMSAQTSAQYEWTWMGGRSYFNGWDMSGFMIGPSGVYGTLGVPSAGNIPGGRYSATRWTDSSGNLWLFGGKGMDGTNTYTLGFGDVNDAWE